ncbi:MAG TPA: hypothetical protein VHG29_12010 [Novosphingobium sp.]|nr:hypothetical protein [Novosphingobium sp.]
MKRLEELREDRALRNAAKGTFDANLAQVRADFDARGVGGRIVDKATAEVKESAVHALEVADQHRGIVAGTLAALVLWFARKPLQRAASAMKDRFTD